MVLRRLLTALGIALLISGGCTYLLARKLFKAAQGTAALKYVVPVHDLEAGQVLKPDDLKVIAWPANAPINGAMTTVAETAGRATLGALAAGQPVSARQLSAMGGLGLSARIPEGMRAISLRSDQVVGVAGFLLPGTHTDVLVTYRNPASQDAVTSTVLQNAEVIAAGQKTQPDPEGKPSTVDVVTLLVNPQDAERVVLASTQGTVHFVLRNGADQGQASTTPLDVAALGLLPRSPLVTPVASVSPSAIQKAKHVAPLSTRAAAAPYSVIVVRGDKQTVETF